MDLHPFPVVDFSSIFLVKPPDKSTGAEARRIHRKIVFDALQWQAAQRHKLGEGLSQGSDRPDNCETLLKCGAL